MHYTQPSGISRQGRKTIEAIKTLESVPKKQVYNLLDNLGFKRSQTGSHQIFRHPKGFRIVFAITQKDKDFWGWSLKSVRNLLNEIEEENSVALSNEKLREKHTPAEVANWKDSQVLAEKNIPNLTKIDLTGMEQKTVLKTLSDAHNSMVLYLQKLGSMMQSTQEYMLDLGVKMDNFKAAPVTQIAKVKTPAPVKEKLSPEARLAIQKEAMKKAHQVKQDNKIAKIKAMQKVHPNFAKNAGVLAALSGVGQDTIENYIKKGLV